MQTNAKPSRSIIATLLLIAIPAFLFFQRWNIYDAYRLQGYTPPAPISSLAQETAMTETGKKLFYVNHPEQSDKEVFRERCTTGEQTIVLGCFIAFQGIFLQDIDDDRLNGVQQVTAAHEMLHAAYQRLSASEKNRIEALLNEQFAAMDNPRIKQTIEDYKNAGADITNELHSILGTEVRDLSPELETYYKRYFTDRIRVVEFSEKYESAFTSRKNQVRAYDEQLNQLKSDIESSNADLARRQAEIENRQAALERYLAANDTESYNAGVPGFNALVDAYNRQVNRVRGLIDEYNAIVKLRNEIALEESELVKAIDTRPTPVQAQ